MPLLLKVNTGPLRLAVQRLLSPEAHQHGATLAAIEHVRLTQEVFENEGAPLATWPRKKVPSNPPINSPARRLDPTPRLQDQGALVGSINYQLTDAGYEIGPADLPYASVHQFGARIPISDKMRGFLRHLGFRVRKSTKFIRIPPRPYIGMADEWVVPIGEAYLSARVDKATEG